MPTTATITAPATTLRTLPPSLPIVAIVTWRVRCRPGGQHPNRRGSQPPGAADAMVVSSRRGAANRARRGPLPRSRRTCAGCSRRSPTSRSSAACGDLDELLHAVEAERPDVVVTDIRMPPTGVDEGIRAAEQLREHAPRASASSSSASTRSRAYALTLLESGTRGARLSPQGAGRRPRAAGRGDPNRRRRRIGDRPEGGRGTRRRARAARRSRRCTSSHRASTTCCARWQRGRTTRRSLHRCS